MKSIDWIVSKHFKCIWSTRPYRDERIHNISLRHNHLRLRIWRHVLRHWYRLDTIVIPASTTAPVDEREAEESKGFLGQQIDATTAEVTQSMRLRTAAARLLPTCYLATFRAINNPPSSVTRFHPTQRWQPCRDERSPVLESLSSDYRSTYTTSTHIKCNNVMTTTKRRCQAHRWQRSK